VKICCREVAVYHGGLREGLSGLPQAMKDEEKKRGHDPSGKLRRCLAGGAFAKRNFNQGSET